MTAPDSGLTDLIAAHWFSWSTLECRCGWSTRNLPSSDDGTGIGVLFMRHLALVVEQHTNGRITELEARVDEWSADYRKGIQARDNWRARAEKAEATIARVEKTLSEGPLHRLDFPRSKDPYGIERQSIREALDGGGDGCVAERG